METTVTRDYSEFKQLDKRVREVAYRYRYAQSKLIAFAQNAKRNAYIFKEGIEANKDAPKHERTVFAVDNALSFMEKDHRDFITNDYLANDDRLWWIGFFSRSTYYRIKRKAMTEFLAFFE